jgi:hypothetical protein
VAQFLARFISKNRIEEEAGNQLLKTITISVTGTKQYHY